MEKPNDLKKYRCHVFRGWRMKTEGDTTWRFPKDFDMEIKRDGYYKVWYDYHDTADPSDTSSTYVVRYVEKIPKIIMELKKVIDDFLEEK